MTDSHRPSGEYPMPPSHDDGPYGAGPYGSHQHGGGSYGAGSHGSDPHGSDSYAGGAVAYPPPPAYEPERPTADP